MPVTGSGTGTPATAPSGRPPRPPLAFRVGVTGARNLDALAAAERDAIRRQVCDVLETVRGEVAQVAAAEEARGVYETAGGKVVTRLRVLSPLAEGADRLVAEVATGLGFALDVALPFAREDYAADFTDPESRAAFDGWLDGPPARTFLELDGPAGRGQTRLPEEDNLAYEAVGRFVVRNCDLLIAVWDGEQARGRGGTAEIARFCARSGRPVWWIDATGAVPPRLVTSTTRLRWQEACVAGDAARTALARLIRDLLATSPAPEGRHESGHDHAKLQGHAHDPAHGHPHGHAHGHEHGLIALGMRGLHRLGGLMPEAPRALWQRWFGPGGDPLHGYLDERARPGRWPWRLYGWCYRGLAGPSSLRDGTREIPEGPAAYWKTFYEPADRASREYGDRYRSSYVWIFLLATAAVVCAVLSLGYEGLKPWATPTELAILLAILGLVAVNIQRRWHKRWIAYRLLAELCRKQAALAVLGWSLPPPDLRRFHGQTAPEAWVGRYFNAAVRAAPPPGGPFRGAQLERARRYVLAALIEDQRDYHQDRSVRSRRAGRRLTGAGEVFFFLTLALVAVKLVLIALAPGSHGADAHAGHGDPWHGDPWHAAIVLLGVCAAILPALSAASVGVRAYAELELLEQQSARMAQMMTAAHARVADLDLTRPLASQDLAAEVFDVATEMLREVEGWAELFRVKAVEAG